LKVRDFKVLFLQQSTKTAFKSTNSARVTDLILPRCF
jgi:hypothetical protein